MLELKRRGFSDSQIARAVGSDMMTGEVPGADWQAGRSAQHLDGVGLRRGPPLLHPALAQCARRGRRWAWSPA